MNVPLPAMINLAVEHWRISAWMKQHRLTAAPAAAQARHALRHIEDVLRGCDLEIKDFAAGHPFDPGLAVRVVDTTDDPTLPEGQSVIAETLAPMVLWRGQVVKQADVVTRRGTQR